MVESKHSINTILSFGAKSVDPVILEQLLVGRSAAADYLFHAVNGIVEHGNNQQLLVIGQRGMGKTHLIRILFHRSQAYIQDQKLVVAYFSEEEYGVSNYFDFLTRIIFAFIRWDEKNKGSLTTSLEELQNATELNQVSLAEKIIDDYRGERPLLILAENFGDILNDIGPEEQGKLRAWMYTKQRISIIATNQSISDDFDKEDRPFYGFFTAYYLKPLSFKDTLHFLISLAELDERQDVVDHLKTKGKAQVRAVYELVKGNHRLLVTFYEFLKSDTLAKLSNHFIKTINDLKPYYETFIRFLPPQQQKILRFVALSRRPQQGTAIQKNCFIDQKTLSKQISELVRKRLLETIPDPVDKRNRLYDINEPLLRISIEVGEHKEGITALFVDFLTLYYDENELKDKISKFSNLLAHCKDTDQKKEFLYEIAAIERALALKGAASAERLTILNEILTALDSSDYNLVEQKLIVASQIPSSEMMNIPLAWVFIIKNKFNEAIKTLKKTPKKLLLSQKGYSPWAIALANLAIESGDKTLVEEALKKFKLANLDDSQSDYLHSTAGKMLLQFGKNQIDKKMFSQGTNEMEKAISLNPENPIHYADLARHKLSLAIINGNESLADNAIHLFQTASILSPLNPHILQLWGYSISFSNLIFDRDPSKDKMFFEKINAFESSERLEYWKTFAKNATIYLLENLMQIFQRDFDEFPETMSSVVAEWVINILSEPHKNLSLNQIITLNELISKLSLLVPELGILKTYIDIYDCIIIKEDQSALFTLSKEQREFFEKYILDRRLGGAKQSNNPLLHFFNS